VTAGEQEAGVTFVGIVTARNTVFRRRKMNRQSNDSIASKDCERSSQSKLSMLREFNYGCLIMLLVLAVFWWLIGKIIFGG
jgi:hypothetical protein